MYVIRHQAVRQNGNVAFSGLAQNLRQVLAAYENPEMCPG
jgi:hypothetical protein